MTPAVSQDKNSFLAAHPLVPVFVFTAICLFRVMLLRDFSPDNELRYLQIADEAIADGHVFAFTLHGEPYADKPPLYLWVVMLSKLLLGKHSMFFLSLFSFIPALVTVCVMDRWTAAGRPSGRVAASLMALSCALFLGMSVFLRMDMLMCMFIVLSLYSFWLMYSGEGNPRRQGILLPMWIFLALFTKGPVGLLMPLLSIVCFLAAAGRLREAGRYLGWKTWGILGGLCAVWFTGVCLDGGVDYLENLVFHQTMGRAVNSFHHKRPLWFYLTAVWYITAPYMFLLVGAAAASPQRRRKGAKARGDKEVFFFTTVVSTFVMLSLFSGKLAIYMAPVIPFMVMLAGEVLRRTGGRKWMGWALAVPQALIAALCLIALGVRVFLYGNPSVAEILGEYSFLRENVVWAGVAVLSAGSGLAALWALKGEGDKSVTATASSMLLAVLLVSFAMTSINDWIGWGNMCRTVGPDDDVATLFVKRADNMEVYLGRGVKDYGKDFGALLDAESGGRTHSGRPLTIIVPTIKLDRDDRMKALFESGESWSVGPYSLHRVAPGPR